MSSASGPRVWKACALPLNASFLAEPNAVGCLSGLRLSARRANAPKQRREIEMKLKRNSPPEAITSGVAIALSTSASGTIRLSRTISGDDNGVPTLDVIEEVGKVSSGLRGLNFAHGGRRRKNVKGAGFQDVQPVDPVPGVIVQRLALDLRRWRRIASDKGSDPDASNEYVNLDRRQSSSAIGRGSMPTPAHREASSP